MTLDLNFCSKTISCRFKSETDRGTFENATILFCLELPSSGNAKNSNIFQCIPLLVVILNIRLIVICTIDDQAHCMNRNKVLK